MSVLILASQTIGTGKEKFSKSDYFRKVLGPVRLVLAATFKVRSVMAVWRLLRLCYPSSDCGARVLPTVIFYSSTT